MGRAILHADLDSCFAHIMCMEYPYLFGKPVSVTGDPEKRHGIILASMPEAKKYGVKTGQPIWQAQQLCPGLYPVGLEVDKIIHATDYFLHDICAQYTNLIERLGMDECYMDVTGSAGLFGGAESIAKEIQNRTKKEIGITVSVGVSYNKVFAKLGSDYKKPSGITVISESNWKEIVWPLKVSDLFWVGAQTEKALSGIGITTIGQLAKATPETLKLRFGKNGVMLWAYANGLDDAPVSRMGDRQAVKTIGNSMTAAHDLLDECHIRQIVIVLSESVSERLREARYVARTICVHLRYSDLVSLGRQRKLPYLSRTSHTIADAATRLIIENWNGQPLRGLEVRASDLLPDEYIQTSLMPEVQADQSHEQLEACVQDLRRRMGHNIIFRGIQQVNPELTRIDIRDSTSSHSIAFSKI